LSDFGVQGTHKHIGFYIGNNRAISNNSVHDGGPAEHDWTFEGKRKVEAVLWSEKLQ
jgi:hypothetical protein